MRNAIRLLLPKSASWARKQWSDLSFTLDRLSAACGVTHHDFAILIDSLYNVHIRKRKQPLVDLLCLEQLPPHMEQLLWPGDSNHKMAAFLHRYHDFCSYIPLAYDDDHRFYLSIMKCSCFFKNMLDKVNNGVYAGAAYKRVRKEVFDFAML